MFGYNDILKRFVVIEGIDGAGTSTQRTLLSKAFEAAGKKILDTWEPTESPIGTLIRQVLRGTINLTPKTMARLFAADRQEHLESDSGIRAFLDSGGWVVCDRYILSSLAYQSKLVGSELVWQLNQTFPLPEYLLFIDVDLPTSSRRRKQRGGIEEIYETDSFQSEVRSLYHQHIETLKKNRPDVKVLISNGEKTINELHRELCGFLGIRPIQ